MQLTPTGKFRRDLKRLSASDAEDVITALELFMTSPQAKPLNFEKVRSRKGYHTIRANYSIRILLKESGARSFDIVAVGNHDYIYESFF
jgi:hypothetical protein